VFNVIESKNQAFSFGGNVKIAPHKSSWTAHAQSTCLTNKENVKRQNYFQNSM